eukprot:TRINITY_DN5355_c0_g1_i1.p1 TRINITY_DN5355_c0_g1~~TRINITY_DN5355_c0_g1_i1.p1  ORF type:complete len:220 (-),score=64.43 TRINITY_DN5355_c0_g1_i1:22-627(-)
MKSILCLLALICCAFAFENPVRVAEAEEAAFDICNQIQQYIPSFCIVEPNCLKIDCSVNLLGLLSFGASVAINPCSKPVNAKVSLNSTRPAFSLTRTINGSVDFPVPGVALPNFIPGISGQLYIDAIVSGSKSALGIDVGVHACGSLFGKQYCLPKPPLTLISGSLNLSGVTCTLEGEAEPVWQPPSFVERMKRINKLTNN